MATPALRLLRDGLPGSFIGGLVRPGLDELIAGTDLLDEVHVDRARGVMGPKLVAAKIRPRRYDAALLLANSFSTALVTRLAFIPRRIGYDRDGRGMLLTDRIKPEREHEGVMGKMGVGAFVPVSAVEYYLRAARRVVGEGGEEGQGSGGAGDRGSGVAGRGASEISDLRFEKGRGGRLELGVTEAQAGAAREVLARAGVGGGEAYAVLNPGANDVAKRWPAAGFGAVAAHLVRERGMKVLVNGAPGEVEVCEEVVRVANASLVDKPPVPRVQGDTVVALPRLGVAIGSLKGVVRGARLMVTNDTGPRHVAAAFGVPLVVLYGPTDYRWTVIPETTGPSEDVLADPTLPAEWSANDHPERCRIDRIVAERVVGAVERVLGRA